MEWLPFSTAYDPSEDPPGSIDPLGTLSEAERLADIILPGFTVRMWRPRLLTYAAVTSVIADRAVNLTGREEDRLPARLVFERLFVASVVRLAEQFPEDYRKAGDRLPGRTLAEKARLHNEPLRSANFLRGQAVNGPFGIMARLSKSLGLIDADGRKGRAADNLILAWSGDEGLADFLEDPRQADGAGAVWAKKITQTVVDGLGKNGGWPTSNQDVWELLAGKLRPAPLRAGRERKSIVAAMNADPVRRRMLELLRSPRSLDAYRDDLKNERGAFERTVLIDAVAPLLEREEPVDRIIATCLRAIDGYEKAAAVLQQIFDALVWGLGQKSGQASKDEILQLPPVARAIERAVIKARRVEKELIDIIADLQHATLLNASARAQAIELIRDDIVLCATSVESAVTTVMNRHQRIQRGKRKAAWIDYGPVWILMAGHGTDDDRPTEYQNVFLHPMRIVNGFSFLRELGLAQIPTMALADEN